jgi:hypothetical protein
MILRECDCVQTISCHGNALLAKAFGAVLILIQAGNTFVRRPPSSDRAFAITALVFYTFFAGVAFLLEKRRGKEGVKLAS